MQRGLELSVVLSPFFSSYQTVARIHDPETGMRLTETAGMLIAPYGSIKEDENSEDVADAASFRKGFAQDAVGL